MTVEDILDQLDEMVEKSFLVPLSGGKCFVDSGKIQELIDDIRLNLPQELRQARAIVSDRGDIIATARREAESIIRTAEERARVLVGQEEIVKQAQQKANDMLGQAQLKAREMRKAASDYIDDLMKRADDALTANLSHVREAAKNQEDAMTQLLGDHRRQVKNHDDVLTHQIAELRKTRQTLRNPKRRRTTKSRKKAAAHAAAFSLETDGFEQKLPALSCTDKKWLHSWDGCLICRKTSLNKAIQWAERRDRER